MSRQTLSLFIIAVLVACLTALTCSGQAYADAGAAISQIDVPSQSQSNLNLSLIAGGFAAPVGIVSPDDGSGRTFIIDQVGLIKVLTSNGTLLKSPFLDLRSRITELTSGYDERGLLGLAFHPGFKENGRIFVFYSAPLRPGAPQGWDHTDRLSGFNISRDDLNRADPGSEQVILEIDHPQPNNNGGSIAFGSDGYLYISVGDGGGSDDVGVGHPPEGNAQNLSTLLGKVLRIDVDNVRPGGMAYSIPGDNPFSGRAPFRPEIFAYGLRNPDISFDSGGNGSLFAADPGQMRWEEVDIISDGGNYGWNIKEGSQCFNVQDRSIPISTCRSTGYLGEPLIDPVIEYSSALGQPIIGGHIYRGSRIPWLAGHYIFGYWTKSYNMPDGGLMDAEPDGNNMGWIVRDLNVSISGRSPGEYILSLGEGPDHELYVGTSNDAGPAGSAGKIYKISRM
ncbi:MAG TPA: PQQ-dependent sugar dehydrogenase [Methanotrichaceae archaeon]|nr:PQQ-dependent sugar dehydrogenase [Methanotrichaceae archaeon]